MNRDNLPYDQVNIICPVYQPGTKEEDAEKYIIYNVSAKYILYFSLRLFFACAYLNANAKRIKAYFIAVFIIFTLKNFKKEVKGVL